MRLTLRSAACAIALCSLSLPGVATGQDVPAPRGPHRWAVTLYLGAAAGGPANDLEAAMTAGGYTERFGGCGLFGCFPESPSPQSYSFANPKLLSVRYHARRVAGVELLLAQAASGSTSGRRQGETLQIDYGGTVVAPLGFVGTRRVRLGVGPALLRSHWDYLDSSDGSEDRVTSRTFGWAANGAAGVPIGSTFEFAATGQYRGFGSARVGPSPSGAPALARASVRSAHWYGAVGLGVTF